MEGINHVFRSISIPDALNAASRIISESFSANVMIEITLNGQHIQCETVVNKELNSTKQNKTPITLNSKKIGNLSLWTVQIITQINLEPITNALSQNIEKLNLIEKQNSAELKIREQKLRNDLLGAISHDLRTPLATIIGSSDTLIENQSKLNEADQMLLLNNIKDDSTWLMNSVENILSLMRVDEGFSLNTRIESIEELFGDVLSRVVAYSNAEIQMHLPDEPIYYAMDIQLMEKVLLNLIDNAHKYSAKGSKIGLTAFVNQDSLVFEVSDTGQGIPDEEKKKIFDRFYTYKTENMSNRRGLGLGLAICKSIVEAHHGRILVKDNKPHGTIMRCVFPYQGAKK
jgi:two-component system sensor histidine kinase KdpD